MTKVFYKNNYKLDFSTIWSNFFLLLPGILFLILYASKKETKYVGFNNMVLVLGIVVILSAIFSICHHSNTNSNLCCNHDDKTMFHLDVIFCSLAVYLSFIMLIYFSLKISENYTYNICIWIIILFLVALNVYFYVMSQKYIKKCNKDIDMEGNYIQFYSEKGDIKSDVQEIRENCSFRKKYNLYHSLWHIMGSIICLAIFFVIFRY
jgi:hypothetical protein